jgi:CRP/FNR family transcriptional regulator
MLDMNPHVPLPRQIDLGDELERHARCGRCPVRDFSICAAQAENELSDISRQIMLQTKATAFEEGARADAVWNVVSGAVLLSKLLQDGRRQVVGIAAPGDLLGLAMQATNSFTATALTPVTLCRFDRARFAELLDRTPRLMRRVFARYASELAQAQDHMLLLGRRSAEEKVAAFLLGQRARWAPLHGLSARVDLPMTRQDIGDYLGLTLETVSRTMTKLAQRKIIAVIPDGVRILDVDKLSSIACL